METKSLLQTVYNNSEALYEQVQHHIARGDDVDCLTEYGESPLRVASNNGRFDVVDLLLLAGADPTQLKWNRTIDTVVNGSVSDIEKILAETAKSDLETVEYWERTPFLIAVQLGDIEKAALLLAHGANRHAKGRCGKTVMQYAIENNRLPMLKWLVAQGFDLEECDEFKDTPLITAAELGKTECVQYLLECGADISRENSTPYRAIQVASTLEVVGVLLGYGEDVNDISEEMHAELLGVNHNQVPMVTNKDYQAGKNRQFGIHNPEETNHPFWLAMIRSGATAWHASKVFNDESREENQPVWCYQRFGRTTTLLDDGRIVEIAGEHEDFYDADFCIYNDVTIFETNGNIRIFSYPAELLPPTDFHSATQVENTIYIIGNLGYQDSRRIGFTPVYRLNIANFEIEKVNTTGEMPGWISRHKARLTEDHKIILSSGKVIVAENGKEDYIDNLQRYQLCLKSFEWTRI